ncbi:MAG: endonuclease/exonuclease/phosphatase family protein, partial [Actinomycetota bacterium]
PQLGERRRALSDDGLFGPLVRTRLRVVTWNLWWRFGPWEERAPAILATLRELDPDVCLLQEVWDDGGRNQAAELAESLGGYHHVYGSRIRHDGVAFGNAVVARWPIVDSGVRDLPDLDGDEEGRTVVRAEIDGPRGRVEAFSTHLHWRLHDGHVRQAQAAELCRFVAETRDGRTVPPIVGGDFNADPDSDEIRALTGKRQTYVPRQAFIDAWEAAGEGAGHTWSLDNPYAVLDLEPPRRIDYLLVGYPKRGGVGHVTDVRTSGLDPVDGVVPSDHLAVVADLRY